MNKLRFVELFAGIGGLGLGLERAGMRCVGQVELDPYCRAVLAKHWPDVPRLEDVRSVRGDEFGRVDLVCGGVPCQPASCAGKRKGSDDERWLWPEFIRIVRACGPTWFVAENVRGFLSLPASSGVVRDMERAGYEVRTVLLGAHHVGAPHRRDRIWIVGRLADANNSGSRQDWWSGELRTTGTEQPPRDSRISHKTTRGEVTRWPSRPDEPQHEWEAPRLVNTERGRVWGNGRGSFAGATGEVQGVEEERQRVRTDARATDVGGDQNSGLPQSGVGVATHGVSKRLAGFARRNALKSLGNSIVPQVAEVIGRAIVAAHEGEHQ